MLRGYFYITLIDTFCFFFIRSKTTINHIKFLSFHSSSCSFYSGRGERGYEKQSGLVDSSVDFYVHFQYCQTNIKVCLRVHIENNILWFDYNLRVWKHYDPYLVIRVDMATFWHPLLLWYIFRSAVVHITVTGPYYGPLGNIFTFAFTLTII